MPTEKKAVAKRTTDEKSMELSEQWIEMVRTGEETAVETLREFVQTIEKVVPGAARQREIVGSGLELAQAVLRVQYDAMRSLVRSAVLVNVNVDTNIDTDVDVKVPTNVDTNINPNVDVKVPTNVNTSIDPDVDVEVPTDVDVDAGDSET